MVSPFFSYRHVLAPRLVQIYLSAPAFNLVLSFEKFRDFLRYCATIPELEGNRARF